MGTGKGRNKRIKTTPLSNDNFFKLTKEDYKIAFPHRNSWNMYYEDLGMNFIGIENREKLIKGYYLGNSSNYTLNTEEFEYVFTELIRDMIMSNKIYNSSAGYENVIPNILNNLDPKLINIKPVFIPKKYNINLLFFYDNKCIHQQFLHPRYNPGDYFPTHFDLMKHLDSQVKSMTIFAELLHLLENSIKENVIIT